MDEFSKSSSSLSPKCNVFFLRLFSLSHHPGWSRHLIFFSPPWEGIELLFTFLKNSSSTSPLFHIVLNQISMPKLFLISNQDFFWASCFKCYDLLTSHLHISLILKTHPHLKSTLLFPIPEASLNPSLLQSLAISMTPLEAGNHSQYHHLLNSTTYAIHHHVLLILPPKSGISPFLTISTNKAILHVPARLLQEPSNYPHSFCILLTLNPFLKQQLGWPLKILD